MKMAVMKAEWKAEMKAEMMGKKLVVLRVS